MIRYALACARGHQFEAWFRSSDTFDALAAAGQVSCAVCGSAEVTKAPMAPALGRDRARVQPQTQSEAPAAAPATPAPPPTAAAGAPAGAAPNADLAALRARIEASSEDVGRRFAEEARAIHDGEAPARPILGEATLEEARDLASDQIPVLPLPWWQHRDD